MTELDKVQPEEDLLFAFLAAIATALEDLATVFTQSRRWLTNTGRIVAEQKAGIDDVDILPFG